MYEAKLVSSYGLLMMGANWLTWLRILVAVHSEWEHGEIRVISNLRLCTRRPWLTQQSRYAVTFCFKIFIRLKCDESGYLSERNRSSRSGGP